MKRLAMEELCGLILLLMVFLAAKYGSVQVVSAQAQKKEQPVVGVDVGPERWGSTEVWKRM